MYHSLLDGPGDVVCLPTHWGEIVDIDGMSRRLSMMIDEDEALRFSLNLYPCLQSQVIPSQLSPHNGPHPLQVTSR